MTDRPFFLLEKAKETADKVGRVLCADDTELDDGLSEAQRAADDLLELAEDVKFQLTEALYRVEEASTFPNIDREAAILALLELIKRL